MHKALIIAVCGMATLACSAASARPAAPPVPPEIPIAMMLDLSTGQTLYARETDRRFVPASVVKVMTAYTAFKLIDEGQLDPAMPYEVSEELAAQWSGEGSSMFLEAGERASIGELLLGVTTISGNDASMALALAATGSENNWLQVMNTNAADLGMSNTHFGSPNGYPDNGRTFTSARDLATLAEAITTHYPALYHRYFGHRQLTWRELTQYNHDPVTGRVAGADGIKTGYTGEAGYTFVGSGQRGARRLVMVLAGAPTQAMRDSAARQFLTWGFTDFEPHPIIAHGALLGQALVQNGSTDHVALRAPTEIAVSLPQGPLPTMDISIRYHGPVNAPIAEGAQIARLHIAIDGMEPLDVPLEAAQTVPLANGWQRLRNGLTGLFGR